MNNATGSGQSTGSVPTPASGQSADNDNAEARSAPTSNNGWVAKRDRHMQLINSAVYDKESQTRAKAMEESRKAKAQKKAQVEQAKVLSYAKGVGRQYPPAAAPQAAAGSAQPSSTAGYQMFFNDIPFRIARGGSKLIRVSSATPSIAVLTSRTGLPEVDDPNTANNTPKRVSVAGVTFVRSKNGNLHRLGAVTSKRWRFTTLFGESRTHNVYRKPTTVKKDELCKRFTTTGTPFPNFGLLLLSFLGFGLVGFVITILIQV